MVSVQCIQFELNNPEHPDQKRRFLASRNFSAVVGLIELKLWLCTNPKVAYPTHTVGLLYLSKTQKVHTHKVVAHKTRKLRPLFQIRLRGVISRFTLVLFAVFCVGWIGHIRVSTQAKFQLNRPYHG